MFRSVWAKWKCVIWSIRETQNKTMYKKKFAFSSSGLLFLVEPLLPFRFWRNYGMCVRDLKNCKLKYELFFHFFFFVVPLVECLQRVLRVNQNKMNGETNLKDWESFLWHFVHLFVSHPKWKKNTTFFFNTRIGL